MKTKITKDGFVWLLLKYSDAKQIFLYTNINVYCLFEDDSESLIESTSDFNKCNTYGIEVGFLKDLNEQ